MKTRAIQRTQFDNNEQGAFTRPKLFSILEGRIFRARLRTCADGVLSGLSTALSEAARCGFKAVSTLKDGSRVLAGDIVMELEGGAVQMAEAEELIAGCMAKPSGIATAAHKAVHLAGGSIAVVCGAWKKMPPSIKAPVREAILHGGASFRIISTPMVYLDKNYLRMFGSIGAALNEARRFPDRMPVVQLRKEAGSMAAQTAEALNGGAKVLMIDTGDPDDIELCFEELRRLGRREQCRVAFAGGVKLDMVGALARTGIDILCIGQAIVDAPLLDMRMDVEEA